MKKHFFLLLMLIFLGVNVFADQTPVKKSGQVIGYIEYSYSEGNYIDRPGWGLPIEVQLYNNTDEYVNVTVTLQGPGKKEFVRLKPYGSEKVTIFTEEGYRGVILSNVYVD